MLPAPIKYPKPPKWSDAPEVLKLITLWYDKYEYSDDDGPVRITRSLDLHDLVGLLRSGKPISPSNRAYFAKLLAELLDQPKRKRGRPKKPKEERHSVSVQPEAKALCRTVIDLLKLNYPKERADPIRDRAITWTVERINKNAIVGIKHLNLTAKARQEIILTKRKLRGWMGLSQKNRRNL